MDVYCSTCGEPWDVDHLRHEAIFDTQLSAEESQAWRSLPSSQKLSNRYRDKFTAVGWEFGSTIVNITRCPCCPKDAKGDHERARIRAALEELLDEDVDGLAATFEDFRL